MPTEKKPVSNEGKIHFHYQETTFKVKNVAAHKSVLRKLLKYEECAFSSVDYIFCSDEFLYNLNRQFLNHDTYTDILTFNLSSAGVPFEAEIYISIERVKENSKKIGVSFRDELDRVMAHGLLHLCGYDDHSEEEVKEMRSREEYYLSEFRAAY